MSNSIESLVRHLIKENNHNMNIGFPAVVVNTDKLKDGFIDVQPIVRFSNSLIFDTVDYPVLKDIRVVFPSSITSTICFPVNQGDYVELAVQSVDIRRFVNGNGEVHDPEFSQHGNLSNVIAKIGFSPYQDSCFNPENYKEDFDNQDLNIVHNKNTANECSVAMKTDGEIIFKSPVSVKVESPEVTVVADKVNLSNAEVYTSNDVKIKGKSVYEFMTTHTHTGNMGSPTSPPIIG